MKILILKDLYDVLKLEWLLKCLTDKQLHAWKPSDMFHSRVATKNSFDKLYDTYGDSYTEDLTIETIKELFNSLDPKEISDEDDYKK